MEARLLSFVLALTLIAWPAWTKAEEPEVYDLVIYGATAGGVVAGIEARSLGKSVVVLEPGDHIGGMTTGGLSWSDFGNASSIGGRAREFYGKIQKHYEQPEAWTSQSPESYRPFKPGQPMMIAFEPKVALDILTRWARKSELQIRLGERLDPDSVVKDGPRIVSMNTTSGQKFSGRMFLDCTYEGDLMAAAGVSYAVGREARSEYDEQLAGVLPPKSSYKQPKRFFGPEVSGLGENNAWLFGIQTDEPGEIGAGDKKIQAYNYRMCLTDDPDNLVPIEKPDGYEVRRYELLARWIAANKPTSLRNFLKMDALPNRKFDINDGCPFSTDYIGANWDYPDGSPERRAEIIADHRLYTQGLFWFLGNDPRVPGTVRDQMKRLGLPRDEFTTTGHWPHQLYIREARRMIGRHVLTQQDCQKTRGKPDTIGLGSYGVDSHHIQRFIKPDGTVENEGNFLVGHMTYEIPYRSITPKAEECTNLLVPVCVSSTHVAFGSVRMEPVFMILGQSAAAAASLAIDESTSVQDVSVPALQEMLLKRGQRLGLQ
jgi:hypothetical protein